MDVFDASPKSVFELFLMRGAAGYYIPAYQREYSWDAADHVSRFIEDICVGINTYVDHEDSITFIGSIISIRDSDNKTVKPYVQGHLPSEVMTIIDGQQRMTTMSLLAIVLHNMLSCRLHKIKEIQPNFSVWFANKSGQTLNQLAHTFELDKFSAEREYRFYPKIIRAYLDQWATTADLAKYVSPIAKFQFGYIQHIHRHDGSMPMTEYVHDIEGVDTDQKPKHKRIVDNIKSMRSEIKKIIMDSHEEIKLPDLNEKIRNNQAAEKKFFGDVLPNEIMSIEGPPGSLLKETLYLLMLSNFFLHRVAVTAVVAKNESYAFDMFEALNTTGEPLTAFETFKPKVIDAEGLLGYENTISRQHVVAIDSRLDRYTKADDKQKATSRLLIPFRLMYEGEKLSKHLSAQRRFLSKAYDKCQSLEKKQEFTSSMSELAIFMDSIWPERMSQKIEM